MSSLASRQASPRRFPPPPPYFRLQFERGGWERVELLYGARTDVIRKWIAITGAQTRRTMRGGNAALSGAVGAKPCLAR